MASQGYWDWVKAGKQYNLIRPARDLQRILRVHGLTVYDYPDEDHLQASRPEDHTPFSVTGWPGTNARWNARALDIMPRTNVPLAEAKKENADIARRIIQDKNNKVVGTEWIKYLNWTDEKGNTFHVSWQPNYSVGPSADAGHVHISGRSDADNDTRAANYDPLREDDDMTTADEVWAHRITGNNPDTGQPYDFSAADMLAGTNYAAWKTLSQSQANAKALADVQTALSEIKAMLQAGGGTAEGVVIIEKIEQQTEILKKEIEAQVEDAVADLAVGGATKVLGPEE